MFGTLDQVERRWVSMGEHRMNVRVWKNLKPDAPTVLLMHGALVSSLYMIPLAQELSRDFHVYVPELPGQGTSPRSKRKLDTAERGGLLAALLDRFDLHDVTIVASSYGSQVATEALITDSSRVRSLLMIGPTVDDTASAPLPQMLRMFAGLPFEAWWFTPLAAVDLVRFGPHRSFGMARELARHKMLERVEKLDVPCGVIRGEHDFLCPEPWANRLAEKLGTEVVTLAHAGHTAHTRAPGAVAAEARRLMERPRKSVKLVRADTFAS